MSTLEYHTGKLMEAEPINMSMRVVIRMLLCHEPVVVILEPGDATRYTLLLMSMRQGDGVSPHLGGFGIRDSDAGNYLFVSHLSGYECPGTWVPFGPGRKVGAHDITELSDNLWSQELLAWWLTNLCEVVA